MKLFFDILTIIGGLSSIPLIISFWNFISKYSWLSAKRSAKKIVNNLINSENKFIPTLIVCIGRGGAIFGSLISYQLKIRGISGYILAVDRISAIKEKEKIVDLVIEPEIKEEALVKNVLLVAGDTYTGKTMAKYIQWLNSSGINKKNIKLASFFIYKFCDIKVDYYGVEGNGMKKLPWYLHSYKSDTRIRH